MNEPFNRYRVGMEHSMQEIVIYHNHRHDAARRTGVTVDGVSALENFVSGDDDAFDPTIRWYIDLRFAISEPLTTVEETTGWIEEHRSEVEEVLRWVSDTLPAGLDEAPHQIACRTSRGSAVRVTLNAQRRDDLVQISALVRGFLQEDWPNFVNSVRHLAESRSP